MILRWSYLRCIDSHIIISVEYMSNFLYISHWVILELSGQTGCPSCYTGAYFPFFSCEDDFFLTNLLQSSSLSRWIFICTMGHFSMIFTEMSLQMSTTFGFWLSYYPWLFSRLLRWDRGSYPSGLFSWDSPVDHSFKMMMDSSNRAFQVKDVWLTVTLRQALWFSQMGCGTIFIVNLTNLTH